jgi:pyruvate dehydrogenase E2 component (dihydrolipoamide acetyltransferase)
MCDFAGSGAGSAGDFHDAGVRLMGSEEILIPRMGEGLQEVRILLFLKRPGDVVKRDEPIYEMETDKATVEVESPYEGVLEQWLAQEDSILPVGAPIARIRVQAQAATLGGPPSTPSAAIEAPNLRAAPRASANTAGNPETRIPPRTRAYCRQKGLTREEIRRIPAPTGTLMPADVDRYLAERFELPQAQPDQSHESGLATLYTDRPLSSRHRVALYRLKRSAQLAIPATIVRPVEWDSLRRGMRALLGQDPGVHASEFQVLAYCVAQAVLDYPQFRSTLVGEHTIRQYRHLNLGIAVQRLQDELLTALVADADTLDLATFVRTVQQQIQRALDGEDQAIEAMPLVLSYLGAYEITTAIPVLVAPASAVLFVGAPYKQSDSLLANLALTFDHRLMDGMAAARFLNTVATRVQGLGAEAQASEQQGHPEIGSAGQAKLRDTLLAAQLGERRRMLERYLCEQVASLLAVAPGEIDPRLSLGPAGLNSLMTLELTNRLAAGLGLSLPPTLIWNYPSITRLASHLADMMKTGSDPGAEIRTESGSRQDEREEVERILREVEQLSDADARRILDEESS